MARPRAACGTISAYRRHLREGTEVDEGCREAKRAHNRARSTSAAARLERANAKEAEKAAAAAAPPPTPPLGPAPTTEDGHVSRLEVLKEQLEVSRETIARLKHSDPTRVYLLMREQRETVREISEIQGNGQAKGVTLADQLAAAREARAQRAAGA
ncbi:hypothetical protein ACWGR3_30265 [Streptomyces albidoflavus]